MTTQNQAATATREEDKKDKRKVIAILLCLLLAIILVIGAVFAFFSDVFAGSQGATAGTLSLDGAAKFYINGSNTEATTAELACINPGDIIKAVVSVENTGSKSAWVQGSFSLSSPGLTGTQLGSAFTVYQGASTSTTPLAMSQGANSVSFTDNGKAILDGTYETEAAAGAIGGTATTLIYTIVFEPSANNDFQGA
ncbi:MAG: hypothetical protein FWG03_09085, partial [Clostridiales bacterium]|nr:hypothetical protein [Clostridiales bacterium]